MRHQARSCERAVRENRWASGHSLLRGKIAGGIGEDVSGASCMPEEMRNSSRGASASEDLYRQVQGARLEITTERSELRFTGVGWCLLNRRNRADGPCAIARPSRRSARSTCIAAPSRARAGPDWDRRPGPEDHRRAARRSRRG